MDKLCRRCKEEKDLSEFSKRSKEKDGLHYYCKQCCKEYNVVYRNGHVESIAEQKAKWRSNNLEHSRQVNNAARRKRMHDPVYAEEERQRLRLLKRNNPGKVNADTAKRRATKLQATPSWVNLKNIKRVYEEADRIEKETGIPQHVDHVVPLKSKLVCGLHCEANLRIIPASENVKKGNRTWPDMP